MSLRGIAVRLLAACATVAVVACSGGAGNYGSSWCVPGDTKACPCAGTAMGVQVCADDGSHYTPCSCGDDGGASSADGSPGDGTVAQDASGSDGPVSDGPVSDGTMSDGNGATSDGPVPDSAVSDGTTSDGNGAMSDGAMSEGSSAVDASTDSGVDATTDGGSNADGAIADGGADTALVDGCVPTGAEDCFNGIDDDCNGLTDCADPACQPVAECVPEAIGFTYSAEVAAGGACPAQFGGQPAATFDLEQGLNAPTTCTGCSCTASMTCTNVLTEGAAGTCPPFTPVTPIAITSAGCQAINLTSKNASLGTTTAHTSCGFSGTPFPTPLSWGAHTRLCSTSSVGAGCGAGNVCVAKATKHCVTAPGVVACGAGYTTEGSGGPWYTGVDDTRSCGVSCGCTVSGGSCNGSEVELNTAPACGGGGSTTFLLAENHDYCGLLESSYQSAQIVILPPQMGGDWPTCSTPYSPSGAATPTGAETVCCH